MTRTTSRRVALAIAATGLSVATVLATPSLAGAQSEPTTTAAPETTTTVPATTSTTVPVMTPDLDVYAPGDKLTLSGKGCQGTVLVAIGNPSGAALYGPPVQANPDGSFTITVTLPANIPEGVNAAIAGCFPTPDSAGIPIDETLTIFLVQRPGTPEEPVGEIKQEAGAAKSATVTKVSAPKSVKSKPTFTG